MRTASRILGFSVSAVLFSAMIVGGSVRIAELVVPPHGATATSAVSCEDNLNWDLMPSCAAAART